MFSLKFNKENISKLTDIYKLQGNCQLYNPPNLLKYFWNQYHNGIAVISMNGWLSFFSWLWRSVFYQQHKIYVLEKKPGSKAMIAGSQIVEKFFAVNLLVMTSLCVEKDQYHIRLGQLCPTEIPHWVKNHATTLMRAADWMTYLDLSKLKFSLSNCTYWKRSNPCCNGIDYLVPLTTP